MKKNKNAPAASAAKAKKNKKEKKPSVPMTKKQIIFTVVASVLIVALVAALTAWILHVINDDSVDVFKDDLRKYISLSEDDYKGIEVKGPFETYEEIDLERRINGLLTENKSADPLYNGSGIVSVPITLGDVVKIMYRGYTVDENGRETDFQGSSNFTSGTTVSLEVGTGLVIDGSTTKSYFIPGFTDAMIGVVPQNYEAFKTIGTGTVEEGDVVYLSYTAFYPDEGGTYKSVTAERIDLSLDYIDEKYGEGFKAFLLGTAEDTGPQKIGESLPSKTFPFGDGSAGYGDMKIEYVTRGCEDAPLTIDVVFPADYTEQTLRGVAAKFDVYISSAVIYDTPEFNEEFITETLKVTAADLESYEGANVVEKYKSLLREEIEASIKETNDSIILEALWDVIYDKASIIELPSGLVDEHFQTYYNEIAIAYDTYTDPTSAYYDSYYAEMTFDDFANAYLNISSTSAIDWRKTLETQAKDVAFEELVFYYIIRAERFIPTEEEFDELYDEIVADHLDYYIELNSAELSLYEGDEYDKKVEDLKNEMMGYYGEEYFVENVYYNYGTDKMIENLAIKK